MSYRNERTAQLNKLIFVRFTHRNTVKPVDKDGRKRSERDIARIKRSIEADIAYMQHERATLAEPGSGLSYVPAEKVAWIEGCGKVGFPAIVPSVGKPSGKPLCLLPYHDMVTRWYDEGANVQMYPLSHYNQAGKPRKEG